MLPKRELLPSPKGPSVPDPSRDGAGREGGAHPAVLLNPLPSAPAETEPQEEPQETPCAAWPRRVPVPGTLPP